MPALSNPRHERFAQEVAKGVPASQAYAKVGYKFDEPNATRLTKNDRVRARIDELRENVAKKTEVTLARLIEDADRIMELALEAKQFGAATAALKELGILSGHRVEKREQRHVSLEDAPDAELLAIARGGALGSETAH